MTAKSAATIATTAPTASHLRDERTTRGHEATDIDTQEHQSTNLLAVPFSAHNRSSRDSTPSPPPSPSPTNAAPRVESTCPICLSNEDDAGPFAMCVCCGQCFCGECKPKVAELPKCPVCRCEGGASAVRYVISPPPNSVCARLYPSAIIFCFHNCCGQKVSDVIFHRVHGGGVLMRSFCPRELAPCNFDCVDVQARFGLLSSSHTISLPLLIRAHTLAALLLRASERLTEVALQTVQARLRSLKATESGTAEEDNEPVTPPSSPLPIFWLSWQPRPLDVSNTIRNRSDVLRPGTTEPQMWQSAPYLQMTQQPP